MSTTTLPAGVTQVQVDTIFANSVSMTDAAIGCKAGGFSLLECAPLLYTEYTPSAQDLANVLCAVWPPDATTANLTTALTSCQTASGQPAYTSDQISQAVTNALAVWHDLLMRDALDDTGQVPYPSTMVWGSPDIWPNGSSPMSNPQQTLTQSWGQSSPANILATPQANYIYVRGKNLFPGAATGQVYLYWSAASLLLRPSIWTQQGIQNENGSMFANVSASQEGDVWVGDHPFIWQTAAPGGGDHWCLLSRVVTPYHPNPLPTSDNLFDLVTWVRNDPGMSWRNTTTVSNPNGPVQVPLVFGNPEPQPAAYLIIANCSNVPVNSTVTIYSGVTGPNPAINTTVTVTNPNQNVTFGTELPANFTGELMVTVTPPSGVSMAGGNVSVDYYLQEPQGDLAQFAVSADSVGTDVAAFTATRSNAGGGGALMFVGNFNIVFE